MKTDVRHLTIAATLALVLPLAACADTGNTGGESSAAASTASAASGAIEVDNCGDTVTFAEPPQRITLMDNPSVITLANLGVLDRVTAKAGLYPTEYYSPDIARQLGDIETLTDTVDATGHLQISREMVVATDPDVIIGSSETVNRQTLGGSVPLLDEPAFCGSLTGEVSYEDAYDQVRMYGTVFGKDAEADAYVAELKERVEAIQEAIPSGEERTVAVLYPTVGSPVTYAYGTASMSHPLVEAAGLRNVFESETDRVFEVSAEDLIERDPDVIIVLHSTGEPAPVVEAVSDLPGGASLTAVQDGTVFPMLLSFAEPPSPLAVDGLEKLSAFLEETR